MIPCTTCNRHYRVEDDACPFCSGPSPVTRGATRAMQSIGAGLTTLVLAACYGGSDFGKYDTSWDSGGTGDTSEPTTGETTTDETGTSDTGTTETGTTGTTETGTYDTGTPYDSGTYTTTGTEDSGTGTGSTSSSTSSDSGY
jgi:hypothetical protein